MLSFEDELLIDESCVDEGEIFIESIILKLLDNVIEFSLLFKIGLEEFLVLNVDVEEGSNEELWEKCLMFVLLLFEDYGDIVFIGESSEILN